MAVAYSKAGRPCLVADIDLSEDRELAFRDEFYRACSGLSCGECMALSRACMTSYYTVLKWKYKMQFPRKDIAQQVIDWVKVGKPMKQARPFPENFNML